MSGVGGADALTIAAIADAQVQAARPAGPGVTVWLTGLSGAGKSTISYALADRLREEGRAVEVLDGDELREALSPGLGFSRADRDAHVGRVGYLARLLARNGVVALVPVIAPYEQTRAAVRAGHAADGTAYLEVHVATPVDECARRDVKGLYAKHAAGQISSLTGVDDPYEAPAEPDLRLDTTGSDLGADVETVYQMLSERGLL
ncbi:adenylylsulfate kinase [Kineosphaera limosa]|uniref:Adenylyl-sulfate kinase n=1 Tax=Kineosphaera limosa NBRC 100340 TaxID=1184609 RepID=K6VLN3_9MICO|nr:adenylyl-sulfate kinase [Kineosphaera limosa]NYE00335.1 adenylylsulfate kinase [Kineosphaera limosa]GAB97133.1 adenylyl-sulfate kinase [Kineosphaera limosa NBRC 100340]